MPNIFIKARHKFSDGCAEWEFFEVNAPENTQKTDEFLKEWAIEFCEEYNWSEHFRGCDYEIISIPPRSWIEDRIWLLTKTCDAYQKTITRYKEMLKQSGCEE